jgi:hypothetical protein
METRETLLPLPASERIANEMIIGVYPASETERPTTASVQALSKETVLLGTKLCVPLPAGKPISDPDQKQRIADELRQYFGGWFENDLTPYIQLHDDFYYLAFCSPPFQVQCIGAAQAFHAVFIARRLTESEAVGEGGHPRFRPLGEVDSLLRRVAPEIAAQSLTDRTAEHASNVFDAYLTDDRGVIVKAGVRLCLTEAGELFPGPEAYFYGLRINRKT